MNRPLVITDCDEVLLHMAVPFAEWLGEAHAIEFSMAGTGFAKGMRHQATGELVDPKEIERLLGQFFDEEMGRQNPIAGAVESILRLLEEADVVVLTNLRDKHQQARTRQLLDHGLNLRVFTNQGPKGPALKAIVDEFAPSRAIFIDDIAPHHSSVAESSPQVQRLHLCGEPLLAPNIVCAHAAGHAHARIDEWCDALPWLLERLYGEHDD
jgi:hypothetical protein